MSDTDRTDIIPGLRPSDTPPMGLPVPEGRHRARRGANVPRPALVVVFGAPIALVAFFVARFVLAGLLFGGEPAAPPRVAPSPTTGEPSFSAEPVVPPVPSRSRADRSRPRSTRPPAPTSPTATPKRSSRPKPTPAVSTPRKSSPPASPSPTRTGSSSTPTPTNTTVIPTPEVTG